MEFQVIEQELSVCETLLDTFSEQPVDMDFVLPDYCPDIAAVLKCTLEATIQSRQQNGDRLTADGTATVRVLYLDEERKCVRCCEFSQPFSASFPLPAAPIGALVRLSAKPDYINCRATSPRRLDVHGAFTVKLTVTAAGSGSVIADIAGDGVYTRKQPFCYTVPSGSAEKVFTISEVMELGAGKQPAEQLLRSEIVPLVTEVKPLAGKAILKGNLLIRALYITDSVNGDTETVQKELPFSQIIDVEGLTDDQNCEIELQLLSAELGLSANQNGESGLLSVGAKLLACVRCYRQMQAEAVTDAYSVHCPLSLNSRRLETSCLTAMRQDVQTIRQSFALPSEEVRDIPDVWCEVTSLTPRTDGNRMVMDGRLLICMLTRSAGGEIAYYERTDPFTLDADDECDAMTATAQVTRVEYNITGGGQMELRVQLMFSRNCYRTTGCTVLSEAAADATATFPPDPAALKIYYANRGESLWEIAKSCHTSIQAVMEENHLPGEVLEEPAMLLVPLV